MNKAYPKWRQRCCDCVHLGLNSPEGIYCKRLVKDPLDYKKLKRIPPETKVFTCKYFVEWRLKAE